MSSQEISTARFRNSDQIRLWVEETIGVPYTPSDIKDLLRRVSASYHKVTGFLWEADPDKQQQFVKEYRWQSSSPSFLHLRLLGWQLHVPGEAQQDERANHPVAYVDLPPAQAVAG